MTSRLPRQTQPRRWRGIALAGAVGMTAATPVLAETIRVPLPAAQAVTAAPRVWLAAGEGGEGDDPAAAPVAAPAEGGEGGEAGAVAGVADDVAYLAQLWIVEGHMHAATDLYREGKTDEAVGLSYHPEAEMMDEVRARVAAHGAADFSPAMQGLSETMERGASVAEVEAGLAAVRSGIAAAAAPEADELRTQFDALVVLLRAAANEYAGATEGGTVGDVMAWHEARSFVAVARDRATGLAANPATEKAATKVLTALEGADPAFGTGAEMVAGDPGILLAVAARLELIASSVR